MSETITTLLPNCESPQKCQQFMGCGESGCQDFSPVSQLKWQRRASSGFHFKNGETWTWFYAEEGKLRKDRLLEWDLKWSIDGIRTSTRLEGRDPKHASETEEETLPHLIGGRKKSIVTALVNGEWRRKWDFSEAHVHACFTQGILIDALSKLFESNNKNVYCPT